LGRSTVALGQGLLASSLAQISWVGRSNSSWAGSPKLETGEGAGPGTRGGGGGRIRLAGVGGGGGTALERYQDVKNPFWGNREEWCTGVALTMVARLAEGGSGEGPLEGLRPEFVWTPRFSGPG
jgi:hypothetical protein